MQREINELRLLPGLASVKESKRAVALMNKSYVLVEDIITANDKPAMIKWNMNMQATNVTQVSATIFLLTFKDKKLDVKTNSVVKLHSYFKSAMPTLTFEFAMSLNQKYYE